MIIAFRAVRAGIDPNNAVKANTLDLSSMLDRAFLNFAMDASSAGEDSGFALSCWIRRFRLLPPQCRFFFACFLP